MKNGTCIETKYCKPCDTEGHYSGDEWIKDKCTSCVCDKDGQVNCHTEKCPESVVCNTYENMITVAGTEENCCPNQICGMCQKI